VDSPPRSILHRRRSILWLRSRLQSRAPVRLHRGLEFAGHDHAPEASVFDGDEGSHACGRHRQGLEHVPPLNGGGRKARYGALLPLAAADFEGDDFFDSGGDALLESEGVVALALAPCGDFSTLLSVGPSSDCFFEGGVVLERSVERFTWPGAFAFASTLPDDPRFRAAAARARAFASSRLSCPGAAALPRATPFPGTSTPRGATCPRRSASRYASSPILHCEPPKTDTFDIRFLPNNQILEPRAKNPIYSLPYPLIVLVELVQDGLLKVDICQAGELEQI